jgi:hypothetical protein
MGTYYFAVDYTERKQMWAPGKWSDKCIYFPGHPLAAMIAMKNCYGSNFVIVTDESTEEEHSFEDITEETYKEWKEQFTNFDWTSYLEMEKN